MKFKLLSGDGELRPHVQAEKLPKSKKATGHRRVSAWLSSDEEVEAVAGFRVSECLASGKFFYVDDLVSGSADRSKGYGGGFF